MLNGNTAWVHVLPRAGRTCLQMVFARGHAWSDCLCPLNAKVGETSISSLMLQGYVQDARKSMQGCDCNNLSMCQGMHIHMQRRADAGAHACAHMERDKQREMNQSMVIHLTQGLEVELSE